MLVQLGKTIFKTLASIKLAVIVIVSMAVISAWGTIVESRYDATTAQILVYHSVFMYSTMGLLIINLTFSMIDRWPWKTRHLSFLLAHVGILMLIGGSYMTRIWGIDGSMAFQIGETRRWITVPDTFINIYHSVDGSNVTFNPIARKQVTLMKDAPEENPIPIEVQGKQFSIEGFYPYAQREFKVLPGNSVTSGPAVRFVLQNKFTSVSDWVVQEGNDIGAKTFGPASVVLFKNEFLSRGGNEILLRPSRDGKNRLDYLIKRADDPKFEMKGVIGEGESLTTPWMDMQFRVLKYLPKADATVLYTPIKRPTELSTSAAKIRYKDQEKWVGLNSYARFDEGRGYFLVAYSNDRVPAGLNMKLKEFKVGRYPGTMRAASYESVVEVEGNEYPISMNEPLKKNGLTFYQASFQEDETGRPTMSILSVNYDPGRPVKYVGSIVLVLGIILLFYRRNQQFKGKAA